MQQANISQHNQRRNQTKHIRIYLLLTILGILSLLLGLIEIGISIVLGIWSAVKCRDDDCDENLTAWIIIPLCLTAAMFACVGFILIPVGILGMLKWRRMEMMNAVMESQHVASV